MSQPSGESTLYMIGERPSARGTLEVPTEDGDLEAWLRAQEKAPRRAWIVAQLEPGVGWGTLIDGAVRFDPRLGGDGLPLESVLEARVFDQTTELLLWRGADARLRGRWRTDGRGEPVLAMDEDWYLWGTRAKPEEDGWMCLSEDRGTMLRLPLAPADAAPPLRVVVRHYLKTDDLGMPSFEETRFVALKRADGKLLEPGAEPSGEGET
ncbi:MAG: hypothetical protein HY690_04355 [Chloroflexi bacterium]|nr:hypothetical protein [Chloroflexota bacterium]